MKLVTLDPALAQALEWLGCDREEFPGNRRMLVLVGPPEILLSPPRPQRGKRSRGGAWLPKGGEGGLP